MSSEPNYICPICGSENHADAGSGEISCEECGYEDDIDEFEKISEGNDVEREGRDDSDREDDEE